MSFQGVVQNSNIVHYMYTQYSTLYVYATKYFSCKLLVIWILDFVYLFIYLLMCVYQTDLGWF